MDRRRLIMTGVTAAAVVAATAVTLPSFAGDGSDGDDGGRKSGGATEPAAELVAALVKDLEITPDQARARLAKEAWAQRTTRELRADLGTTYAGAWLDANASKLTVAVTDEARAARVRAAGAEPKLVARSGRQLDQAKAQLDRNADAASPDVAGWYVDVASNQVVVLAQPGAERVVRAFVAESGADRGADNAADGGTASGTVRVQTSEEAPVPFFDVIGGEAYFIGGAARCSVGFSVVGGFVTAGHCGQPGATTSGGNQEAQGTFTASSFPGDDWGVVEVNGDWVPQPVVRDFNGGTVPVAGSQEAPVGASICRSGSTTGTVCGRVQALNATVNYPEGTVTGLTRTDVCAEPGDSGGSWISGDQAQGVTSGGSGDCTRGGITFFQPVNEILERNNLTLVTADEAPPADPADPPATTAPPVAEEPADPPAEPPADGTGCATGEVNRSGTIAAGTRRAEPNGRFFRAGAGRHTACLDGPDGADLDLVLQRWSGAGWRTVARASTPGADETLTFRGRTGSYRYLVLARSGSGDYDLAFSLT